jgi:Mrp family chromosome partitioning ATPase
VSSAIQPVDPYFPKIVPIVTIVALATFIMTAIAIMLSDLFSGRALRPVSTLEDDERTVGERIDTAASHQPKRIPAPSMLAVTSDEGEIVEEPVEHEVAADDNEFAVASVAQYLLGSRAPLAIAISPTGDDGSAATVALARKLAAAGSRVVLVDMTGSGHPTDLMAERRSDLGVTDLLCGEAAFGDTIHADRSSDAHIIPQGTTDMRRAMRGADRLSLLLDALASAYDLVLVECGAANVAGVSRLTHSKDVEIILSMPEIAESEFVAAMTDFEEAGYQRVVLMSGGDAADDAASRQAA